MPYRESSLIATLLSQRHGRVSIIAKGARRSASAPLPMERGQIVDLVLYVRPHRDLHTAAQISIVNYFPSIRADIGKLALRDAAVELILASLVSPEPHPGHYDFAARFLDRLEAAPAAPCPIHELWRFFYGWAGLLGFMLNLSECVRCNSRAVAAEGGALVIEKGALLCSACGRDVSSRSSFVPGEAVAFLLGATPPGERPASAPRELMRVARLLSDYCRFHIELRSGSNALDFLDSIL